MGSVTSIWVFVVTCLALAGRPAHGQTFGSIDGEGRDNTGAAVSGVTVSATNKGTNARTAITNDAGAFSFPSLAPGTYTLRAEKPGFKTIVKDQVELQVQLAGPIDFELQIGQVSDSIEVNASSALLVTDNATVGTVIENKRIAELPLNGRNYLQLVSSRRAYPRASPAKDRHPPDRAASVQDRRSPWPASAPISITKPAVPSDHLDRREYAADAICP